MAFVLAVHHFILVTLIRFVGQILAVGPGDLARCDMSLLYSPHHCSATDLPTYPPERLCFLSGRTLFIRGYSGTPE